MALSRGQFCCVSRSLWGLLCPRAFLIFSPSTGLHRCTHLASVIIHKSKEAMAFRVEDGWQGHLWAPSYFLSHNSPQWETRKRQKWKPKPGGMGLPSPALCFGSAAARTRWPAIAILITPSWGLWVGSIYYHVFIKTHSRCEPDASSIPIPRDPFLSDHLFSL